MTPSSPHSPDSYTSEAESRGAASGSLRALLWFALEWGLLLVLLSFVMPIVTVWSGHDGPQPRASASRA